MPKLLATSENDILQQGYNCHMPCESELSLINLIYGLIITLFFKQRKSIVQRRNHYHGHHC